MDTSHLNHILKRQPCVNTLIHFLAQFKEKTDNSFKRGAYVYGEPGIGKTCFVENILKELNYDVIKYDSSDIRNNIVIENIASNNTSNHNIMSLFQNNRKPIAIIMDEIDGMNNGDKGGLSALIKLIRKKKTKKQQNELSSCIPIICINNHHQDKKIKELMKACVLIELQTPTISQIQSLIIKYMVNIDKSILPDITLYIGNDLRKYNSVYELYIRGYKDIFNRDKLHSIFKSKTKLLNTKEITSRLFRAPWSFQEHVSTINESDRTILGMLWHENIIDLISQHPTEISYPLYCSVLDHFCFADYTDRIIFQNQIWQLNEMNSIVKLFNTNKLYHTHCSSMQPHDIRFTKVLTKYSTEYNNYNFIQFICHAIGCDKKDVFALFTRIRTQYTDEQIYHMFEPYDITKLDIKRLYKYLNHIQCIPNV